MRGLWTSVTIQEIQLRRIDGFVNEKRIPTNLWTPILYRTPRLPKLPGQLASLSSRFTVFLLIIILYGSPEAQRVSTRNTGLDGMLPGHVVVQIRAEPTLDLCKGHPFA